MNSNKTLKIRLKRNLRRLILQGHPWVYREAIDETETKSDFKNIKRAHLCQVIDAKGPLAWAMYDPHSPLSLRILSTEKEKPCQNFFLNRFSQAAALRKWIPKDQTNTFRLFNGEGDGLPGLICDVYNKVAVVQWDGKGPEEFWGITAVENWIKKNTFCQTVLLKNRGQAICDLPHPLVKVTENNAHFIVNLAKGQKTGLFLDQRDNRLYIRQISSGKNVLNLFSYTGGFSVNAGLGGARRVVSLDISKGALESASINWAENQLNKHQHETLCLNAFDYIQNTSEIWDLIIVDPPNMSPSEGHKSRAKNMYIELFTAALNRVPHQGELAFSSCSSHINFSDFYEIIRESFSNSRKIGQILKISGQGSDHPFPLACPELRYLKFVHLMIRKF